MKNQSGKGEETKLFVSGGVFDLRVWSREGDYAHAIDVDARWRIRIAAKD